MRLRLPLLVFCLLLQGAAARAAYPERPVKIIVPFSAGAAADTVVRPLAARLSQAWGQQVLVENRPGLTVGPQAAAAAPADGYTLLFGAASTMVTTPITAPKLPYDVKRDFVPITRLVTLPPVLTVNAKVGVKTLAEFVALAKARPGALNYASSGMGAPNHLGMEYLLSLTGGDLVHVPYKGAAPAVVELVGNQVQAGFNALPSVLAHIRSGRLVALAVGSQRRAALLPDVPAVAETVPGFEYIAWYGLFAPTGTPAAVLEKVRADVVQALRAPEIDRLLRAEGSEPAPSTGPELARLIEHETALWLRIIKERHIKLD
jgi:tripartite-type tricarboxylate transporter receptor subunit TctC